MNLILSNKIFQVIKDIEKFNEELNRIGIHGNDFIDFLPLMILWFMKVSILFAIVFVNSRFPDYFVSYYMIISIYMTAELYTAVIYAVYKKIQLFKKYLYQIRETNKKVNMNDILKIPNTILKLIRAINRAFSVQILAKILMLLLSGIIFIFLYSIRDDSIPFFQPSNMISAVFYIHFVTFQISLIASQTIHEIKNVHGVLRKIYNSKPHEENLVCLDVNLDIIKYNCGLFDFDWSLMKMILIQALITIGSKDVVMQSLNYYSILTVYATAEIYITITWIFYLKISHFRCHLEKIQKSKNYQMKINENLLKIPNRILKIIKSINKAFSIQVLATIFMLLLFGVILIFIFSVASDNIPVLDMSQTFLTVFYIHFESFQISLIGELTGYEIRKIHRVLRKIYNSKPIEDNLICLDVTLDVTKYNCGLIDFDWNLMKMV
ncbi:hypothetical protein PVAND_012244 [Polypedilum vanderplanki]|uniref:Gustatory receptor n=1 Tax=Polypedilum vanderplanki TaxID=319348 RepID=A0A9J6CMT5_POLVA|nr:hypothetical protein PVAND_012244 [Polypedilum vanderplanki]